MSEKKGECAYFPEITNCAECEYFREVARCAVYNVDLTEKRKKTFAELAIGYLKEHPNCEITLRSGFGLWNDCILQIYDRSKDGKQITAQQVITNDLFEKSKMTHDEILNFAAEKLRKELDNYGRK